VERAKAHKGGSTLAKRVLSRKSNPLLLTCDSLNALMAGQ